MKIEDIKVGNWYWQEWCGRANKCKVLSVGDDRLVVSMYSGFCGQPWSETPNKIIAEMRREDIPSVFERKLNWMWSW